MKKIILALVASALFIGCGSGGSKEPLNNLDLMDGVNHLGYYGKNVILSDIKIVGTWTVEFNGITDVVGFGPDGHLSPYGEYGVAKDGKSYSELAGIGRTTLSYENLGNNCLRIKRLVRATFIEGVMCKVSNNY